LVFAPAIDAVLAASIFYRVLMAEDVEVQFAPYSAIHRPVDSRSIVVLIGSTQRVPVQGLKVVLLTDFTGRDPRNGSSESLHLIHALRDVWILTPDVISLAIVGAVSTSRGSVYDYTVIDKHRSLLEEQYIKDAISISESLTLFGYPLIDVVDAVWRTIDPFLAGLSFNPKAAAEFVANVKSKSKSQSLGEVSEILASELKSLVSRYYRRKFEVKAAKFILKTPTDFVDVYETYYIFQALGDTVGYEALLFAATDISTTYSIAYRKYLEGISTVLKVAEAVINNEMPLSRMVIKGIRATMLQLDSVGCEKPLPLTIIYRILNSMGYAEDFALFKCGSEYYIPGQILEAKWPAEKEIQMRGGMYVFSSIDEIIKVI